jgi:hypothetical protein
MVKPLKLFLVLFGLLLALVFVSLIFPKEGIDIGSFKLRYPSISRLLNFDPDDERTSFSLHPELALLERYIDSITSESLLDTTFIWNDVDVFDSLDSTIVNVDSISLDEGTKNVQINLSAEILKSRLIPIEMPDTTFSALNSFFKALSTGLTAKEQIRVMHYGDSQIEGDRITSFLRLRLQSRFGGGGVGLLHAVPHSYQPGAVYQSISSNWQQILLSDLGSGAIENRFGILGGYSIYTKPRRLSKGAFSEAWIEFERRGSKNSNPRNFTKCRVFYGYATEPFLITLGYDGKTQDAEMIAPTNQINQIKWDVPLQNHRIKIEFKGDESPMVYGISLESNNGIIVDNIPIRGSTGKDFTRADDNSLKSVFQLTKPKLVILQFGVNVVPHIVESYKYYENQMYQQVVAIKRAYPKVSVILIGVSDMSLREGGQFVSYPNIEKIRDAQRNAAIRSGAAFWDCYAAMGGKNSMPAWAFANPPLASKDFVHFTLRGSNLIAEMFYSSLMESYDQYKNQNEKP